MIGVVVDANEQVFAAEFFELLKTPWEFFRTDGQYDVVLSTAADFRCENAKLLLAFGAGLTTFDSELNKQVKSRARSFVVSDEGKRLPIYGTFATFPGSPSSFLKEEATQEPVTYVGQCGMATVLRVGYNLFAEVCFLLTDGQPAENSFIPTLEEQIALVRSWITLAGIASVEIPPVPEGHKFIACLTHDLDHPAVRNHWCDPTMFGFLYRATIGTLRDVFHGRKSLQSLWKNMGAACLLPFVYLGIAGDFWRGFDRYLEMEEGRGSTFFVIPRRNYSGRTIDGAASQLRSCRYEVEQLIPQLKRIVSAGGEVGVHGLDAWLNANDGRQERERVSQAIGSTELGVRMHWLFFDRNSPALLDQAGFTYDSTVGYRETVGYRAGTTQAYKPLGATRLLELPLHVMDTALFYPRYLHLRDEEAECLVWRLIDDAERIGGALTINWHDRSIAPERLWDEFYLKLLHELSIRGAWLPTSTQAVAWFRSRRLATVECERSTAGVLRVQGRMDKAERVPGLRIRVHKPRARSLSEPKESRRAAEFVDVPFARTTELNIEI